MKNKLLFQCVQHKEVDTSSAPFVLPLVLCSSKLAAVPPVLHFIFLHEMKLLFICYDSAMTQFMHLPG